MDRIKPYLEKIMLGALCVLALLVYVRNIPLMKMPCMLNDEIGYWSVGAYFSGTDWTSVASSVMYYSYGYGLILAPLFHIFDNAVMMYRTALLINAVMLTAALPMAYSVGRRIFPSANRFVVMLSCFAAMMYPSVIVQGNVAWSETLLTFMVWLIFYCVSAFDENRRIWLFLLGGFAAAFTYVVHQRTLGIVFACILAVLCMAVTKKIKLRQFFAFVGVFIAILTAHSFIKPLVIENAYLGAASLGANDYSGQFGKIKLLFTADGIKSFIVIFAGQFFYLGAASLLTAFVAGVTSVHEGFSAVKKTVAKIFRKSEEKLSDREQTMLFLAVTCVATVFISSLFHIEATRWDQLVYGRYNEVLIAPAIMTGLITLFMCGKKILIPTGISVLALGGTGFVLHFADRVFTPETFNMMCSVCFYDYYNNIGVSPLRIFLITLGIFAVLALMALAVKKIPVLAVIPAAAMSVAFFSYADRMVYDVIRPVHDANYTAINVVNFVEENRDGENVYFLRDGSFYVDRGKGFCQFLMKDTPLICVTPDGLDNCNGVIITMANPDGEKLLEENHEKIYAYNEYSVWEKQKG